VGDSACQLILDHYDSEGYATDIIGLLEEMRRDPAIAPAEILATRVRRGAPHP
jgi:hypothetical protein